LRKKWDFARREVKTARDFIEKIATKSYIGGQPYLIRFKDGREVKSGDYLSERLKEIESPKKPWPPAIRSQSAGDLRIFAHPCAKFRSHRPALALGVRIIASHF
jgi:hypothetical protein